MTHEQIIEGNKLIEVFMGEKFGYRDDEYFFLCEYATSWAWLMPVVEKLESMKFFVVIGFNNYCGIADARERRIGQKWESCHTVSEETTIYTWKPDTKIEAVYIAIIKFLTWYNQQPKK